MFLAVMHLETLPWAEPSCSIPHHTIPHHTIPYHTKPYHTIQNRTIPYKTEHTIQNRIRPFHTIQYNTYHSIPCNIAHGDCSRGSFLQEEPTSHQQIALLSLLNLSVEQKYFIPKNTWHRLINKNRSNLVIEVKKIK